MCIRDRYCCAAHERTPLGTSHHFPHLRGPPLNHMDACSTLSSLFLSILMPPQDLKAYSETSQRHIQAALSAFMWLGCNCRKL
eukprot:4975355-Amphidinium_carterae.2